MIQLRSGSAEPQAETPPGPALGLICFANIQEVGSGGRRKRLRAHAHVSGLAAYLTGLATPGASALLDLLDPLLSLPRTK